MGIGPCSHPVCAVRVAFRVRKYRTSADPGRVWRNSQFHPALYAAPWLCTSCVSPPGLHVLVVFHGRSVYKRWHTWGSLSAGISPCHRDRWHSARKPGRDHSDCCHSAFRGSHGVRRNSRRDHSRFFQTSSFDLDH